jgi:hypothetical protein
MARSSSASERILIRVQPPGSFPQDGTCDLGERCTAGDHWRPLETARLRWHVDKTWTRHAPLAGQRRSASRTLPGKETPAGYPRQASPARAIALLGGALAGSGPGTSPYVGAVPGHRHGVPQRSARSSHAHDHGLSSVWSRTPSAVWSCATRDRIGRPGTARLIKLGDAISCSCYVSAAARHPRSGSEGCRRF